MRDEKRVAFFHPSSLIPHPFGRTGSWSSTVGSAWTRRQWLAGVPAAAGLLQAPQSATRALPQEEPFGYCLNTSTLQGQKLDLVELVDLAAQAGYQAIEPWVSELDRHVKNGG